MKSTKDVLRVLHKALKNKRIKKKDIREEIRYMQLCIKDIKTKNIFYNIKN